MKAPPYERVPDPGSDRPGADGNEPELIRASTRREHFVQLARESFMLKFGIGIASIVILLAILGDIVAPFDPTTVVADANRPPDAQHWFGTDNSGFDIFSRVISAPRVDLTIAVVATILSILVGSTIGLLASFSRGKWGESAMRASDTVQSFPLFVLALIIVVMSGKHLWTIIVVIALLNAPIYLRLMRGEVISLRERTFVEAAHANGDTGLSIAVRHVLPNAIAPAFAQAGITFGMAILIAAGLSFIGAGVQPPTAEWGSMIASGKDNIIIGQWWASVFPGLAMSVTVFAFAIIAEALQAVVLRRL